MELQRFNVGDVVSIEGYPDGSYRFGGWSGEHAYYTYVATGQSVWASMLPPAKSAPHVGYPFYNNNYHHYANMQSSTLSMKEGGGGHALEVERETKIRSRPIPPASPHALAEDSEGAYDPFADTSPPPQPSVTPLKRGGKETGESGGGEEERGGREAAQPIHTQPIHSHSHQLLDGKQDRREERQSSERNSSEHAQPQRNGECGKRHRDCAGESRQGDTVARDTVRDTRDTVADTDTSESPPNVRTIYIWDLDETLIVFNSLLTNTYRSMPGGDGGGGKDSERDSALLLQAAERLEELVYCVAEEQLFFKELEGRNRWCFAEAHGDDDGAEGALLQQAFDTDSLPPVLPPHGCNATNATNPQTFAQHSSVSLSNETPRHRLLAGYRYREVRQLLQRVHSCPAAISTLLPLDALLGSREACRRVDDLTDHWLSTAQLLLAAVKQDQKQITALIQRNPPPPQPAAVEQLANVRFHPAPATSKKHCTRGGGGGAASAGQAGGGGGATDINILVTNGELVPTVAKLLLFHLFTYFDPWCIYSSRNVGKRVCFAEILRLFPAAREVIAIGDSKEEEEAAKACNIKFVKVQGPQDLRSLHQSILTRMPDD